MIPHHVVAIEIPDGRFTAAFSNRGLCEMDFPPGRKPVDADNSTPVAGDLAAWIRLTRTALHDILEGKAPRALPPFDISEGTAFQQKVWRALLAIPLGRTLTYAEIATEVGSPKALRAVGGACGANQIPVLIPCHRVVASHGRLGGFSGRLQWKRKLLQREGVLPEDLI